jgi:hypothetical protein
MCLLPVSAADVVAAVFGVWNRPGAGYVAADGGPVAWGVSRFPRRVGDLLFSGFL